jgi:hypothetical protein
VPSYKQNATTSSTTPGTRPSPQPQSSLATDNSVHETAVLEVLPQNNIFTRVEDDANIIRVSGTGDVVIDLMVTRRFVLTQKLL